MNFKQYLTLMVIGTLAATASWMIVLVAIDPVTTGVPTKIAFYLTFLIMATGVVTIIGTLIRVLLVHKEAVVSREVAHALRQGVLFSMVISLALFMSSIDYLRWWTMLLMVVLFAGIELFLLTSRHSPV